MPSNRINLGSRMFVTSPPRLQCTTLPRWRTWSAAAITATLTFALPTRGVEVEFCELVISTTADRAYSVFATDVDGDGDIDVLSASFEDDKIAWYENDGGSPPGFTERVISTNADRTYSVFAMDIDGDGDMDVLSASQRDSKIAWYESDGGLPPTFVEHVISTDAAFARSVFAADVDGDGEIDVLSASMLDNKIAWYKNDGGSPPSFNERIISTAADSAKSVFATDMDGDGDIDVLSASTQDDKIAWYENDGGSPPDFIERVITTGAVSAISVFAIDLDGDGDTDVLSASSGDDKIAWYESDGGLPPTFSEHLISTQANNPLSVFAADLDGDGDIDVLSASSQDDKIMWYINDGGSPPIFTHRVISTSAETASAVFAADVDGDGDIDVLSASQLDDKIAWYPNNRFRLDCNENGITDDCEVADGSSDDCNSNFIPDECDIADGTSTDDNSNDIPDECEDCNDNGIPDNLDIVEGTSTDCNSNGFPDECEPPQEDCNTNGIGDLCDIVGGTSDDCNTNDIPDSCESSEDCNNNEVQDFCDLAAGTSDDCDTNGIPDECQPDEDCNTNGVNDFCDIAAGTSLDCNDNQVPDSCDIALGTSPDDDGDGIPDECCSAGQPALQRQFDENGDSTGPPEPKNRVLAINAGDAGQQQAIRVTWDAQPNYVGGHTALVGQRKWMTEPFQACENSGNGLAQSPPDCGPSPGQPQKWFWAARLSCDASLAYYGDYATLTGFCTGSGETCIVDDDCSAGTCGVDGVIHLFDQGIVPTKNVNQQAIYSVQVLDLGCAINEDNFSDALVVTQPVWGDLGAGTDCPMAPPDGRADIIPDVTRSLQKFMNALCAPKKTRADLEPSTIDFAINATDFLNALNAFAGVDYPFAAGPACSAGG